MLCTSSELIRSFLSIYFENLSKILDWKERKNSKLEINYLFYIYHRITFIHQFTLHTGTCPYNFHNRKYIVVWNAVFFPKPMPEQRVWRKFSVVKIVSSHWRQNVFRLLSTFGCDLFHCTGECLYYLYFAGSRRRQRQNFPLNRSPVSFRVHNWDQGKEGRKTLSALWTWS